MKILKIGTHPIFNTNIRVGAVDFQNSLEMRKVHKQTSCKWRTPETRFIWAHNCGRASADQIKSLLTKFPNLMVDRAHMFNGPRTSRAYGKYWPRKTPWINLVQNDDGSLVPEMKALFESFPDRFMIGTDVAHTPLLKFYEYRIAIFRVFLSQLSAPTGRKIGYENAEFLFAKPAGSK